MDLGVGGGPVVQARVGVEDGNVGQGRVAPAAGQCAGTVVGVNVNGVAGLGKHPADVVGAGDVVGDDAHDHAAPSVGHCRRGR